MDIVTTLIPVAAAAIERGLHRVGAAIEQGHAFTRLLQESGHAKPPATLHGSTEQSRGTSASRWSADSAGATGATASDPTAEVRTIQHQRHFASLRAMVHHRLMDQLKKQGVDVSEPLVLGVDALGRVLEVGGHMDRAVVEEALARDPVLREGLVQLLALGTQLWESNPRELNAPETLTPRLVVDQKDLFFQVV